LVYIKEKESNLKLESDLEKGNKIIDENPSATITTTKIQPDESKELDEGEPLFHSQMWVKETPLHFIVDSGSKKNLISVELIKILKLSTMPHP
jgi:hypothetical protein